MELTRPVCHILFSYVGIVLSLTMTCLPHAHGAEISKCIVDGKTVYQEAPCANGGKVLKLDKEIPKEQVLEANRRASEDRERSTGIELGRKNAGSQEQSRAFNERQEAKRRAATDCSRLAREVESAEARLASARPSPATRNRERGTYVPPQIAQPREDAIVSRIDDANGQVIKAKMNQKSAGC